MSGFVYLLKARVNSPGFLLVKIGLTDKDNVAERFNSVRNEWLRKRAIEIELLEYLQVDKPSEVERKLHEKFLKYRQESKYIQSHFGEVCSGDSEWFLVPQFSIIKIKNELNNYKYGFDWDLTKIGIVGFILFLIIGKIQIPKLNFESNFKEPSMTRNIIDASPNYTGVNVRDENLIVIGYLSNNTQINIKSGRKKGYCETDKGWIYCLFIKVERNEKN